MRLLLAISFLLFYLGAMAQPPDLVVQSGHTAWINDYNISPDSKYMATASVDNTIKLWDLRSKKEVRSLMGHKHSVNKLVFSHNNKMIASGDDRGFVFLWEVKTGRLLDTFHHKTKILGIAFSEDDGRLATTGSYEYLTVRELKSRSVLTASRTWAQGSKLAFLPGDPNIITFMATDTTFNLWDIRGDSISSYIYYTSGRFTDFTISKNGRYLISTIYADSSIRLFDLKDWKGYKKIHSFNHYPEHITTGDGDSTIFTSSNFINEGKEYVAIKKWNFYTGQCLDSGVINTESFYIPRLVYAAQNKELVLRYRESQLAYINTRPISLSGILKPAGTLVNVVIEKEPGKFLLIAEDGPVKELDVATNAYRILIPTASSGIITQLEPLGDSVHALARINTRPHLYKVNTTTLDRYPLIIDSNGIRNFKLSQDGKRVAYYTTASKDGRFINKSEIIVKETGNDSVVFRKAFSSYLLYDYSLLNGGQIIAYQEKYDTITLTDIADGTTRYLHDSAYKYSVANFCVALDAKRLLTGTQNGRFYIWDLQSGKLLQWLTAHEAAYIYKIVFSKDSSQFISLADEVVKIWDTKTLRLKQSFTGHLSWVSHGGFLKGEKELYTCSADQTFRIWDAATGKEKASFMMVDTASIVTRLPNNYYTATRQGMKYLSYRINNELYPFEQFDLQYNRPHEVLKALGAKDTALVGAYKKAYERRLKKSGFKESDFNKDIHLPETIIVNSDQLPSVTKSRTIKIPFKLADAKYEIDRYFVSVNNVPVNGANGTSLKNKGQKTYQSTMSLQLSAGMNRIQVSCMNNKGVESLRKDVYINYQPDKEVQSKLYFIGIGVSRYKDKKHNLTYADKDTRDLAELFKSKYPQVIIDTLLNESATAQAIAGLKEKLNKTAIDDIVIISVSSHGLVDKTQNYYIGTHDVDFNNPAAKGLRYEALENLLEDIPARKKLLLIDACHSGEIDKEENLTEILNPGSIIKDTPNALARGVIDEEEPLTRQYKSSLEIMNELFADVSRANGALIISAAGGKEYAFEDAKWNNGVFTYCVKRGLAEGLADSNGDGISVAELRNYVSEQVHNLTGGRQKPTTRKENIEFDWKIWTR